MTSRLLTISTKKNTTVSLCLYDENDRLRPIGGEPVPGSDYELAQKGGNPSKNDVGTLVGLTQVMNRHWLAQINLSADRFTGYLNDPYKILSVIDDGGATTGCLYEKRPDRRTRESVCVENRIGGERESVAIALRYFTMAGGFTRTRRGSGFGGGIPTDLNTGSHRSAGTGRPPLISIRPGSPAVPSPGRPTRLPIRGWLPFMH